MRVCVCVCVCSRSEGGGEKGEDRRRESREPALLSDTLPGIRGAPGYASASALLASHAKARL